MKKRNIIFILLILFLSFITTKVYAYTYSQSNISISALKNNGWIITWPTTDMKVSDTGTSTLRYSDKFYFNEVLDGSKSYVTYASGLNKSLPNDHYDYSLTLKNEFSSLQNSSNNLTDEQRELLEYLLVSGYYPTSNTLRVDNLLNSKSDTLSLIAMQILVWEVMEGGRTTFATVSPTWNGTNSVYNNLIYPNGADSTSSDNLYGYYKKIVNAAYNRENPISATAFNNSEYQLEWDSVNKRYSRTIVGLGDYRTCVSASDDVKVKALDNGVLISADSEISKVDIVCSFYAGNYSPFDNVDKTSKFYYFKFNPLNSCTDERCQDLIYGSGYKLFSKSFKVTTENTKIKVKKVGIDKKEIDGSTFRLTNRSTTSYNIIIKGNDEAENINKSGEYIVSEIVAPKDYEKISDFKIVVDSINKRVTGCDNSGTDSQGNLTCMNSQVTVTYVDDTIILNVIDVAKNFKIYSLDENNIPLHGVTYQIKDSKDELVKFNLYDGNIFGYDKDGHITNLNLDTASYPIALLPEGEYKIVETAVPNPYILSSDENNNITKIKINSKGELFIYDSIQKIYISANDSTVQVKNYKTRVGVITTGNGMPLSGVIYKLYREDKSTEVASSIISPGYFNYDPNGGIVNYYSNPDGIISINNLPPGTYYFKQITTQDGYVIHSDFIEAKIDVNKRGNTVNGSNFTDTFNISNTLNAFNFYKTDIHGTYISNGKFKVQRYNAELSKFEDVKVIDVNGAYTEDSENGRLQFTTTNGFASFVNMPAGTYRIVETVAPEGYERAGYKDTASVIIDENGNASGLMVLKNKTLATNGSDASAELIVNIQTGQPRIMYAAIIITLILIIGLLIYFNKKKK